MDVHHAGSEEAGRIRYPLGSALTNKCDPAYGIGQLFVARGLRDLFP
jgi:hypothetical protein